MVKEGLIFDIQRYAIRDGPGIRTTIFFKGCPLRCSWCHNPEGQEPIPELLYRHNRCIECETCVRSCPNGALTRVSSQLSLDKDKCTLCKTCVEKCPSEALSLVGRRTSSDEIINEVERDMVFFEESHGGVTFSGGEPLYQPDFLNSLLMQCRKRGIHTTLDTSGYASPKTIDRICRNVDLVLYDIKVVNDNKHRKYTGVSNKLILQNLKRLARDRRDIVITFPVVLGMNDGGENVEELAEFLTSLHFVKFVSLLPYHKAGVEKYRSLGRSYDLAKIKSPSDRKIQAIKTRLEETGFSVKIGGR